MFDVRCTMYEVRSTHRPASWDSAFESQTFHGIHKIPSYQYHRRTDDMMIWLSTLLRAWIVTEHGRVDAYLTYHTTTYHMYSAQKMHLILSTSILFHNIVTLILVTGTYHHTYGDTVVWPGGPQPQPYTWRFIRVR